MSITIPNSHDLERYYWDASAEARELADKPSDDVIDLDRARYIEVTTELDDLSRRALAGESSGRVILDNLIASGQLMSPTELDRLDTLEQMLAVDEPILLQQGFNWKLGIIADNQLYFSKVHRNSPFRPLALGFQAVPARSYVDMRIDPFAIYRPEYTEFHFLDVRSIEPINGSIPAEAGSGVGLPLQANTVGRMPTNYSHPLNPDLLTAWQSYDKHFGRPNGLGHGGRNHEDMILIGRDAVESSVGMSLDEVAMMVENSALLDYVTTPGR